MKKKQLFLSTAYFIVVFSVDYIFNLVYKVIFPVNWYTPHTLIQTIQFAGIMTICLTYGDYKENKAIRELTVVEIESLLEKAKEADENR